jgi:hypothetical protein
MKNFTALLICTFVMIHSPANAQFQEGESFVSGTFYLNFDDSKTNNINSHYNRYSHDINVSIGKFRSSTFASGWGIDHGLSLHKFENFNIDPKNLQNLRFGIERFWEFYKPLNDKLALYLRPDASLSYQVRNAFETSNDKIITETHGNSFSLNLGVSAGIAWRIAPKWAIYGGFAFLNPLSVSYGFGHTRFTDTIRPDGEYPQTNTSGFAYRFSPQLSSGSIGLGLRYFYGRK